MPLVTSLPLVVMSHDRARADRFLAIEFLKKYFSQFRHRYVLVTEGEEKAYQAFFKKHGLRGFKFLATSKGMHEADTFVTTSNLIPGEYVFKIDDDCTKATICGRDGNNRLVPREATEQEFLDIWQYMLDALHRWGMHVAGCAGSDLRSTLVRYSTNMASILDTCQIRRKCPCLVYPPVAAMKADWAISMLGFLNGGIVKAHHLSITAEHYSEGGLGKLTTKRKREEDAANAWLASWDIFSGIRARQNDVTSVAWKRPKPRVVWRQAGGFALAEELGNDVEDPTDAEYAEALQLFLSFGGVQPGTAMTLSFMRDGVMRYMSTPTPPTDTVLGSLISNCPRLSKKRRKTGFVYQMIKAKKGKLT